MESDVGVIIAIIGVGIAMVGVVISMMFWARQESNTLRAEAKEDRKDFLTLLEAIREDVRDFHQRLCSIEERKH
jgi:hypothetical protein